MPYFGLIVSCRKNCNYAPKSGEQLGKFEGERSGEFGTFGCELNKGEGGGEGAVCTMDSSLFTC